MDTRYAFIGGGNMAQAMIAGLLDNGVPASYIQVVEPYPVTREQLAKTGVQVLSQIGTEIKAADLIVLAVKPQIIATVCEELKPLLQQQPVLSIAAGITLETLVSLLGNHQPVIRAMPNTPALIREGMTGLYGNSLDDDIRTKVQVITDAIGKTVWLHSEDEINAVTAVSGSGPAYFFYIMEAMIAAGTRLGLPEEVARQLVLQTARGAALLADSSPDSPAELRRKVTSPNGTTQAAIESMQKDQIDTLITSAISRADLRSRELAAEASSRKD